MSFYQINHDTDFTTTAIGMTYAEYVLIEYLRVINAPVFAYFKEMYHKRKQLIDATEEPLYFAMPARDTFFRKDELHARIIDRLPCADNR